MAKKCKLIIKEKWIFVLIAFLRLFFYMNIQWGFLTWDSYELIDVDTSAIFLHGKLHARRVPVYPLLLDLCNIIANSLGIIGDSWIKLVVVCQIICSFLAVIYFYKTLKRMDLNSVFINITTLFYGCTPVLMGYDTAILTESLSLSGTVFFVYYMIKYLYDKKVIYGVTSIILAGVLTFMRPSLALLPIILGIFWLWRFFIYKTERPAILKCGRYLALLYMIIVGYIMRMDHLYNQPTLSQSLIQQELVIMASQELWQYSEKPENLEIKNYIRDCIEKDPNNINGTDIQVQFGTTVAKSFIKDCKINGFSEYIKYIGGLLFDLLPSDLSQLEYYTPMSEGERNIIIQNSPSYFIPRSNRYSKVWVDTYNRLFPCIAFVHVYLLLFAEGILLIIGFKSSRIEWLHLGLFGIVLCTLFLGVVGTYAEWGRTVITIFPLVWIMIAVLVDLLYKRIQLIRPFICK